MPTTYTASNDVGNFAPVLQWLNTAVANGAARPRIKIRVVTEGSVTSTVVGLSLPRTPALAGRDPVIYVKINGDYVGHVRVKQDGSFFIARSMLRRSTMLALRAIGDDPLRAAVGHGHTTGNCSFCARDLSDPRSTSVGYGPICAGRFGLPWGDAPAPTVAARIAAPRRRPLGIGASTASQSATVPTAPVVDSLPDLAVLRAAAINAERACAAHAGDHQRACDAVRVAQENQRHANRLLVESESRAAEANRVLARAEQMHVAARNERLNEQLAQVVTPEEIGAAFASSVAAAVAAQPQYQSGEE
jgi:hypothetical protein